MPMNPIKALILDKRVLSLLAPLLAGLKGVKPDATEEDVELDFEAISRGLQDALGNFSDTDYEKFVNDLLQYVTVKTNNGALACNDSRAIGVFSGNLQLIYKLMIEVMRFNKFTPFALVDSGVGIRGIVTSLVPQSTQKENGTPSETSVSSTRRRKTPFQSGT